MKKIFAMMVGMSALPMTTATRYEYCAWDTIPWDKPYSAEIVPNVRPVDMRSV
jgi:hypothetical protein